ncbi:hypothetical protein [Pseudorhodoferax soli]|uniref:hypothetical protein n=1 Tax=Pseudorhodoferax soli TaxID=545864 RepID=UPI00147529E7|nr:hypothetical protein [Pseudorhodoferax soli]
MKSIANAAFPLHVDDQDAVRDIQALRAAGFIEASVSAPSAEDGNRSSVVHRIAPEGRAALARERMRPPRFPL